MEEEKLAETIERLKIELYEKDLDTRYYQKLYLETADIENSNVWKATKPLRDMMDFLKQRIKKPQRKVMIPEAPRVGTEFAPGIRIQNDKRLLLAFDHRLGGGASLYLGGQLEEYRQEGWNTALVSYDRGLMLQYDDRSGSRTMYAGTMEGLTELLPEKITEIWVNELISYPALFELQQQILCLAREKGARLVFKYHDHFSICPTFDLLDSKYRYCGIREPKECRRRCPAVAGMREWRTHWEQFLTACDEVTVFSEDSEKKLNSVYPGVKNIRRVPHRVEPLREVISPGGSGVLTVGIIGSIYINKGSNIVREMCRFAEQAKLPVRFRIIGTIDKMPRYENVRMTGAYQRSELPELLERNRVDLVLIPSICPETFCFTCAEAIRMGLPVACFDLGGQADLVRVYDKGIILKEINAEKALKQLCCYAEAQGQIGASTNNEA